MDFSSREKFIGGGFFSKYDGEVRSIFDFDFMNSIYLFIFVSDFVVFWSCLVVYIGFYSVFG